MNWDACSLTHAEEAPWAGSGPSSYESLTLGPKLTLEGQHSRVSHQKELWSDSSVYSWALGTWVPPCRHAYFCTCLNWLNFLLCVKEGKVAMSVHFKCRVSLDFHNNVVMCVSQILTLQMQKLSFGEEESPAHLCTASGGSAGTGTQYLRPQSYCSVHSMSVQILQEADPKTGLNVQKYYKGTTSKRSQKVQDSQLTVMQSAPETEREGSLVEVFLDDHVVSRRSHKSTRVSSSQGQLSEKFSFSQTWWWTWEQAQPEMTWKIKLVHQNYYYNYILYIQKSRWKIAHIKE